MNIDSEAVGVALEDLFAAYASCRKNKRNTFNALAFELDYEHELIRLCKEINNGRYQPGRSIAFIVDKPVKREIFAADFRDRVVHHYLIGKLEPLFERTFIADSYACRKAKGTHKGIQRAAAFMRQCSKNGMREAYALKMDIKGFFMHINKAILLQKLRILIDQGYTCPGKPLLLSLCEKIIFNDCVRNCTIKGSRRAWIGLPPDKSLFHSPEGCGLPIGNLTSQIFANVYLNDFDHFIKHDLQIRYYGRYVDDCLLIHHDKFYLRSLIPVISDYLQQHLHLCVHPKKVTLRPVSSGVAFLGAVIKQRHILPGKRLQGNFYAAIQRQNAVIPEHRAARLPNFLSCLNAYLGLMKPYHSYLMRKRLLLKHLRGWWDKVYLAPGAAKLVKRVSAKLPWCLTCQGQPCRCPMPMLPP